MSKNIETLKKLTYTDLQTFVEELNYNFAVLENSPFYKGIAGRKGEKGETGITGQRGIKFIFISFERFNTAYIDELKSSNDIDINYINRKIQEGNVNSSNRDKFYKVLNVTDLILGDVLVLTNTKLLTFNGVEFEDTGMAFDSNFGNSKDIETIVKEYVENFILQNDTIKNLRTIFTTYLTHAKNYQDVSNTLITTSITNKSVYEPYKSTNKKGILVNTHKYIGLTDGVLNDDEQKSTIILGSVNKFIKQVQNSFATDLNKTLTSDYSVGVNNEPSVVILQNDNNSGILFGHRDSTNFKSFAKIYRNNGDDTLNIESNVGINGAEYGSLKLHKEYLRWNKDAYIERSVDISHNLFVGLNIRSSHIRTGEYTVNSGSGIKTLELGYNDNERDSITFNTAYLERYKHYISNVLITDNIGNVSKEYSLETTAVSNSNNYLDKISGTVGSNKKIVTSNYLGIIIAKINQITDGLSKYWTKDDFERNVIPKLFLTNEFKVGNQLLLNEQLFNVNSNNITYSNFRNNVFVTNNDGKLSNQYSLETQNVPINEVSSESVINQNNSINSNNKILTSYYYSILTQKINNIVNNVKDNYYKKIDWTNFNSPSAVKNIQLRDANVNFNDYLDIQNNVGIFIKSTVTFSGNIKITSTNIGRNTVLSKDDNDNVVGLNKLWSNNISNINGNEIIPDSWGDDTIVTGSFFNRFKEKFNNLIKNLRDNYFTKTDLTNGTTNLSLNELSINENLKLNYGSSSGFLYCENSGNVKSREIDLVGIPLFTVIPIATNAITPPAYGWVVCDGKTYQLTNNGRYYQVPDLRNRFIKGTNSITQPIANDNFRYGGNNFPKLRHEEIPPHSHFTDNYDGEHRHEYYDSYTAEFKSLLYATKNSGNISTYYGATLNNHGGQNLSYDSDNVTAAVKRLTTTEYNLSKYSIDKHTYWGSQGAEIPIESYTTRADGTKRTGHTHTIEVYNSMSKRSAPKRTGKFYPQYTITPNDRNYFFFDTESQESFNNQPAYCEFIYYIYIGSHTMP